jgi:hypothetical protein
MIDYTETEMTFNSLMALCDPLLTISDIMEVNDWFNHREYGLGLATLVSILSEKTLPLPDEIVNAVKAMAVLMQMDDLDMSIIEVT